MSDDSLIHMEIGPEDLGKILQVYFDTKCQGAFLVHSAEAGEWGIVFWLEIKDEKPRTEERTIRAKVQTGGINGETTR